MSQPKALRLITSGFSDRAVERLARDTQQAFDSQPTRSIIRLTQQYTEPMFVVLDHEPDCLYLGRILSDAEPEDNSVTTNTTVHFTYVGGKLRINAIDGLIVGEKYRFTFEAVN